MHILFFQIIRAYRVYFI